MKPIFLVFVLLASIVQTCLAQGEVYFANAAPFPTEADRFVRFPDRSLLYGTNYLAQLYYEADAGSLTPVPAPPTTFRPAGQDTPGEWYGVFRTLPGYLPGMTVTLQVNVWDGSPFPTYEEAANASIGLYGSSAPFTYPIPASGPLSSFSMDNLRGFTLIPEPSITLLIFAGAVLLLRRRRR